jgi:multidrug resistance efflux pump
MEKELKDAETLLLNARSQYENAQQLYSLGYISKKDMNQLGDNYQKALSLYRDLQEKLLKL